MKPSIPKPASVDSAFRVLEKRLAGALKRVNRAAAVETRSGDYDAAQKWMEIGRSLADFSSRANAYSAEWKRLVRATRLSAGETESGSGGARGANLSGTSGKHTPAWEFYKPALAALASGGTLTTSELIALLEPSITPQLVEHDLRVGRGKRIPRWHRTVTAMRRPCQREGWIEKGRGDKWTITDSGREVAARDGPRKVTGE